jgi:hypothetical protein
MLTVTSQRTPDDCLRAAVSIALGVPYNDTPAVAGGKPMSTLLADGSWERWAIDNGRRWAWSWEFAPIFLKRWIAVVDGLGEGGRRGEGVIHAVAMEHDRLLYEPTEGRGPTYEAILPTDVRRAMWALPARAPDRLTGRCWLITEPEDCPQRGPGVFRHEPRAEARGETRPCGSGCQGKEVLRPCDHRSNERRQR